MDKNQKSVPPIALGKATRITQFLLTAPKEYVCLMHLHKPVEQEILDETVQKFQGKIEQLPPIKSAVKRQLRVSEKYTNLRF